MTDEAGLTHPNPRIYWLVLRLMAIFSGVLFVIFGAWGVNREPSPCSSPEALCATVLEHQHEVLMQVLEVTGYAVLIYMLASQGVSAVEAFVNKGRA